MPRLTMHRLLCRAMARVAAAAAAAGNRRTPAASKTLGAPPHPQCCCERVQLSQQTHNTHPLRSTKTASQVARKATLKQKANSNHIENAFFDLIIEQNNSASRKRGILCVQLNIPTLFLIKKQKH